MKFKKQINFGGYYEQFRGGRTDPSYRVAVVQILVAAYFIMAYYALMYICKYSFEVRLNSRKCVTLLNQQSYILLQ